MIEFTSKGTHTIDLTNRTNDGPKVRLTVYAVDNPTDVPSREALDYLIGQTVLIDGVERIIHSVESFCIGGVYRAGRPIGLAVEDKT